MIARYLARLQAALATIGYTGQVLVMQSNGDLIAFDMGGTTAKATLVENGKSIYSLIDLREILLGCNQRYLAFLSSLDDPSAGERDLPSKIVTEIGSGALWRHTTASGGGWGLAAERSMQTRARDLAQGKTTADDGGAEVDAAARTGRSGPGWAAVASQT